MAGALPALHLVGTELVGADTVRVTYVAVQRASRVEGVEGVDIDAYVRAAGGR